jgi:hypothetical protein
VDYELCVTFSFACVSDHGKLEIVLMRIRQLKDLALNE